MGKLQDILAANPALNILSRGKLLGHVKDRGVTRADIEAHFAPKEITQVYAPAKKAFPLKITAQPYTFQMDIALLPGTGPANNKIEKFLALVDIISRKAYCFPLKSGSMVVCSQVFVKFFQQLLTEEDVLIAGVQADDAFNNATFKKTCEDLSVPLRTDVAKTDHIVARQGDKLGIVDRFIRTIKVNIQKYSAQHDDPKWTKFLPKLVDVYNATGHTGLQGPTPDTTPDDVFDDADYAHALHVGQQTHNRKVGKTFDVAVGDTVRVRVGKGVFDKEKANYSADLYTITAQVGYRFRLKDEAGAAVDRLYRPGELLKVRGQVKDRLTTARVEAAAVKHKSVLKVRRGVVDKSYDEAAALQAAPSKPRTRAAVVASARPVRDRRESVRLTRD